MENTNNKILTVCFMIAGVLAGLVLSVILDKAAAVATGGLGQFLSGDVIRHGVPVLAGLVLYLALQFNKGITVWGDEVVTEIRRVVWPSRKDTFSMTVVVCIMVLISGLAIGFMDMISAYSVDWLLHINFGGIF